MFNRLVLTAEQLKYCSKMKPQRNYSSERIKKLFATDNLYLIALGVAKILSLFYSNITTLPFIWQFKPIW